MDGFYKDRIYLGLQIQKGKDGFGLEVDEFGNPIVYGVASNEKLDFDGEQILQSALEETANEFIANGVVSYDHRHLTEKDNPEQFIIGEPIEVKFKEGGDKKTLVKFKLYKNNEIAKEIIKKLKDGANTVRISIGGKMAQKVENIADKTKKIVSVLWDEIALTYKPVNQSLEPVTLESALFVKSIQGQNPTILEDLQGATPEEDLVEKTVNAIQQGLPKEDAFSLLTKKNVSQETIDKIQGRLSMGKNEELLKSLEDSVDELFKSVDGSQAKSEKPVDPASVKKGEEGEESTEEDDPDSVLTDKDFEESDEELKAVKGEQKKLKKSINDLASKVDKLIGVVQKSVDIQKSLLDSPVARQSAISKSVRFKGDGQSASSSMTQEEIIRKSIVAVRDGRITSQEFSIAEDRWNKGKALPVSYLEAIK